MKTMTQEQSEAIATRAVETAQLALKDELENFGAENLPDFSELARTTMEEIMLQYIVDVFWSSAHAR